MALCFSNNISEIQKEVRQIMRKIFVLLVLWAWFPVNGQELPRSEPSKERVSSLAIIQFLDTLEQSEHEMHSLMVVKNGKVIAEGWWDPYQSDIKQTMYSVSKSFTATAIGFAVKEKLLSVDDRVLSFFPDHSPEDEASYLYDLRVRDLLTMSVGHEKDMTFDVIAQDDWPSQFLKIPIIKPPGTHFVYNTIATYMLSAILQQITGETLLQYLQPRLFEPLSIVNVDWETDPMGVNVGGYGLRLKTEDMAKFGQLMLQRGQWHGQQLLPIRWIVDASSVHIFQEPTAPIEKREVSDWHQGYGYQMWRSRHQSFRADGAFGQYILVLPELGSVVAITSETDNMQALLNLVWEFLLPGLDVEEPTPEKDASLRQRLEGLYISPFVGIANTSLEEELQKKRFEFTANDWGMNTLKLYFNDDQLKLVLTDDNQESFPLEFGKGTWLQSETLRKGPNLAGNAKDAMEGLAPFLVAGSYGWKDDSTLVAKLNYLESPHTETIEIVFEDKDNISLCIYSMVKGKDKSMPVKGSRLSDMAQVLSIP